jgi:hypothetical protein
MAVAMSTVVARGTGATLVRPATVRHLAAVEAAHPAGTRWAWRGQWTVVTLPALGPIHTGALAAAVVNAAWRGGQLVSGGHRLPLWPGDAAPAAYDTRTRVCTIRWVGASAFIDGIVAALAGITAGFIASTLGLAPTLAATVGIGVALAVGAAFVVSYLSGWTLLTTHGGPLATGLSLTAVALVAVAVPLVVVLERRRRAAQAAAP